MTYNIENLFLDPPTQLTFDGFCKFDKGASEKTTILRLYNSSSRIAYFKVSNTVPHIYHVSPWRGVIQPNSSEEVIVRFIPVLYPSVLERNPQDHKFMIQSAFASSDTATVDEFWEAINPEDVMCSALSVLFNGIDNANEREVLVLEPQTEITFDGFCKFGEGAPEKAARLNLYNFSNRIAYFKINNTVPLLYHVNPCRGII
jgi:hypothetical protein